MHYSLTNFYLFNRDSVIFLLFALLKRSKNSVVVFVSTNQCRRGSLGWPSSPVRTSRVNTVSKQTVAWKTGGCKLNDRWKTKEVPLTFAGSDFSDSSLKVCEPRDMVFLRGVVVPSCEGRTNSILPPSTTMFGAGGKFSALPSGSQ